MEVEVKVRAVNRGETEVAERDTVIVMPRPIPGIKSVNNSAAILFTGRGQESDEELRERAKNTLISAGKASKISLENALLSLPGVRDASVNERFYKARGNVNFIHGSNLIDVTIPRGTQIILTIDISLAQDGSQLMQVPYKTLYLAVLPEDEERISIEVEAEDVGAKGEVADTSTVIEWTINSSEIGENDLEIDPSLSDSEIKQKDFGIIEVFVDGPDLTDPNEYDRISAEVDRVKAAGIYAIIKGVQKVLMEGIFRFELPEDLSLSDEERVELENEVTEAIKDFIKQLKMGVPLRFTQLISEIIRLEGVENMDEFIIKINKPFRPELTFPPFDLSNKKIELEANERLDMDGSLIFVASEDKPLPINLELKVDSGTLSEDLKDETILLNNFLTQNYPLGTKVFVSEIETTLENNFIGFDSNSLRIIPQPIFERNVLETEEVDVEGEPTPMQVVVPSFVEYVTMGTLFAYENYLDLIGAIKFSLDNPSIAPAARAEIMESLNTEIEMYFNEFGPAEKVLLEGLQARLEAVEGINTISLVEEDFLVELNGQIAEDRIEELEVEVKLKEKLRRHHLCISDQIEDVNIAVSNLVLTMQSTMPPLTQEMKDQAISERVNLLNSFMSNALPGQDVSLSTLISILETPSQGISIVLDSITLTATSDCPQDQNNLGQPRIQILSETEAQDRDIQIRTNERAVITPIVLAGVTLNNL